MTDAASRAAGYRRKLRCPCRRRRDGRLVIHHDARLCRGQHHSRGESPVGVLDARSQFQQPITCRKRLMLPDLQLAQLMLDAYPGDRVVGQCQRLAQQPEAFVDAARWNGGETRRKEPARPGGGILAERCRPLEKGCRDAIAALRNRFRCSLFECRSHPVVRRQRGGDQVPRPPFLCLRDVGAIGQHLGKQPVRPPALRLRRALVGRAAHQRMAEIHRGRFDDHQAAAFAGIQVRQGLTAALQRLADHRQQRNVIGGNDMQRALSRLREPPDAPHECLLERRTQAATGL